MDQQLKKRMIIMIVLLVIIFGAIFGWDALRTFFMHRFFASFQPPPVAISTVKAETQTWQPYISTIGTLQAVNGVEISPEVAGIVEKIYFQSGQKVKQGQALVKLDDSIEQADLQNFQAQLILNKLNYQRNFSLYGKKAISKADVDQADANLKQSQALVAKELALIAQKNIVAPFTGIIGIKNINIGQFVSAGTSIVSLQAIAPIYVNFYLPEQDLPKIYLQQPITITVDLYPDHPFSGKITAINAEVNTETHNIMVQATLPNETQKLYPGLFANIHIIFPEQKNVIAVPDTAVTFSLFGDSVFVIRKTAVDKKGKPILRAQERYVVTGETKGGKVVILEGLNAGDLVVTSGQLKLDNNTRVLINNSVALDKKENALY